MQSALVFEEKKKRSTACDTSPRGDAHRQTAAPRTRARTDCSREAVDQRFRTHTQPANVERSEELCTRATNTYTKKQPVNSFRPTFEVPRHELLGCRAVKKLSEFLFFFFFTHLRRARLKFLARSRCWRRARKRRWRRRRDGWRQPADWSAAPRVDKPALSTPATPEETSQACSALDIGVRSKMAPRTSWPDRPTHSVSTAPTPRHLKLGNYIELQFHSKPPGAKTLVRVFSDAHIFPKPLEVTALVVAYKSAPTFFFALSSLVTRLNELHSEKEKNEFLESFTMPPQPVK